MDEHRPPARHVLSPDLCRKGMVHWYEAYNPPGIRTIMADLEDLVAYSLAIYLLNLFLAFLQPKFDPSNEALDDSMEDGSAGSLPTKADEEFRPFIRRLPEFKFWHSATRAIAIGFCCTWFSVFDVPVFWPVLVFYWLILFTVTSKSSPLGQVCTCTPWVCAFKIPC